MSEIMNLDLEKINAGIADRHDVFYWQTDRAIEPEQAGHIWADRHRYFTDGELLDRVNGVLGEDSLVEIEPLDLDAQTNLGNVNSVRVGRLTSGKEVVIRCHPKGVKNGYFHAEAVAAGKAKEAGLPSYDTLVVHDYEGGDDFAFQVIEKLPDTAIMKWLETKKPFWHTMTLPTGTYSLTDKILQAFLDWDECVGGIPESDIACWSTFFDPERLKGFLDGYFSIVEKPDDFDDKFELMRLRYVVSKMTLRLRRYYWEPTDFMCEKIETGKTHLAQSMKYFGLQAQ